MIALITSLSLSLSIEKLEIEEMNKYLEVNKIRKNNCINHISLILTLSLYLPGKRRRHRHQKKSWL